MLFRIAIPALIVALLSAGPAAAHGSERGFVLLLPTGYYLAGGALAVAASFLLLSLVPARWVERLIRARPRLGSVPEFSPVPTSLLAFLFLVVLLLAGIFGSRDPLANPLPLTVWTLWWVGLPLLQAVLGNLWAFLNPWTGPYRLADRLSRGRLSRAPLLGYPEWLGYWPAVGFFFGFAWLELVHPAPDDPEKLATAVGAYWLAAFAGMLLFGQETWTARGEPFSIFFRLIAGLSPLVFERTADANGRCNVALAFPGAALVARGPLSLSGIVLVLLTLSSVSFDGLSKTFWWLGLGGINPLEYPGRSAVMGRNTLGLIGAWLVLTAVFRIAVSLGAAMAGGPRRPAVGALVLSIVPISLAFHFSHYLPALMVDGQYALIAASDPFGSGLDLFGLADRHATTSFLSTYDGVRAIWNFQTAGIVVGHAIAVVLAHAIALRHHGDGRRASLSQVPLAVLMVLYTLFGLWLLSTPVAG